MRHDKSVQVVVITGAASGIGQATAVEFSKRGADLVLAGRNKDALEQVRKGLVAPARTVSVAADVTNFESLQSLAHVAVERFGQLDVWVNNAVVGVYGDFEEVPLKHFRQVFETAFFGYVHGASAVLPYFRQQRAGVLINVASVLGVIGIPHMSSYVAAKHAVVGFSECLRQELANTGIEVCTVLPASIDTPFYEHAANFTGRKVHPVPPVYAPELVAKEIVRLASKPRKQVFVPRSAAILPVLRALTPQTTERVSAKLIDKFQIGGERVPSTMGNLCAPMHERSDTKRRKLATLTGFAAAGIAASLLFVRRPGFNSSRP